MNAVEKWTITHILCLFWGVGGIILMLTNAIWRISDIALQPILAGTMNSIHWIALIGWVVFMAYSEGYRGFQKAFSPRVVARAIYIGNHPTLLRVILAPIICMGLMFATKKRLIVSWILLIGIVFLIVIIQYLNQPWRGIVDMGVLVGLGWGTLSLVWFLYKALIGAPPQIDPDVPDNLAVSI